jgi:hypothetical protein
MKTEIKFESHELTIIRVRRSQAVSAFCPQCEQEVLHLTIARAAAALQISETAVFRLVESNAVHSMETAAGALLICGNSLSELRKQINGEKNNGAY